MEPGRQGLSAHMEQAGKPLGRPGELRRPSVQPVHLGQHDLGAVGEEMSFSLDGQHARTFRGGTHGRSGFTAGLLHPRPQQEQQPLGVPLTVGVE